MQRLKPLMIGGAGSDVGKTLIVAGLCRILRQDGYNPAPFKAQNMALNSFVTPDGLELGRAQAMQAEAAGIECMAEMNPILMKPIEDCVAQIIINGVPAGNHSAKSYFSKLGRPQYEEVAHHAFDRLSQIYNPIILEGAGSIAEINLMDLDIVNMPMARYADASVILVVDIDRGGVFASAYGSIMLQQTDDRKRIKGIIVNKFRGDLSLFENGRKQLEKICGIPVVGIMPFINNLHIEEEDSCHNKNKNIDRDSGRINIAVVRLTHISNFTDFDPLEADPRVNLFYTTTPSAIADSDIIILPGSKSTISDLSEIVRSGVGEAITRARERGKTVIGICGGYQMMGRKIMDPEGVDGGSGEISGLGLLPTDTIMVPAKQTSRIRFRFRNNEELCVGYEIHNGRTDNASGDSAMAILEDGRHDGCMADERCWGTYIHGLFENKTIVDFMLSPFVEKDLSMKDFDYRVFKQSQYDRLANEMRQHLDIDILYKIMSGEI